MSKKIQHMRNALRERPELYLFMLLIVLVALGNGFSDAVYGNYYKEVYNVTAQQRAFIEFPRELPGVLCSVIIAALAMLGDYRLSIIAQILALFGLTVMGLSTPPYALMLVFLFINSLGMHLFFPLQDSIGMSLAEPDKLGRRVGQYASIRTACAFVSGIIIFITFRTGVFTFKSNIRPVFLVGSAFFLLAMLVAILLLKVVDKDSVRQPRQRIKLLFKKEYKYYYVLTALSGVQKQLAYVYGSWVVIELLLKGTDVMSMLTIVASFVGILFYRQLGKWLDRFGVKRLMTFSALMFITIYMLYGFVVWAVVEHLIPGDRWKVMLVYLMFILDRMSMQTAIVNSIYLKSIALVPADVTPALSAGVSLDHVMSIIAAQVCGLIWVYAGPQYVFFFAAVFSLGNLYVARKVRIEQPSVASAQTEQN
ncbi:MAG TPA: MFS transporter [Clostridiales bacterium]|nr:MFS transporter [Clostridiales bacterium]